MHKAPSVIVISPELNELETFRIEQRAKMKGTSPRMEYLNYKCTPEYRRQRLLDGVRLCPLLLRRHQFCLFFPGSLRQEGKERDHQSRQRNADRKAFPDFYPSLQMAFLNGAAALLRRDEKCLRAAHVAQNEQSGVFHRIDL